jgi:hypothetical protein
MGVGHPEGLEEDRRHLAATKILRKGGVKRSDIIGAYHVRRVAPLMARALPMHRMVPVTPLEGMVLAEGPLANSKITQRLKEVMDSPRTHQEPPSSL